MAVLAVKKRFELLHSDPKLRPGYEIIKKNLAEIKTWLRAYKLSLNVKKTKYSVIASHNKLANLNYQFDVKIDEHFLVRAKSCKYLGIDLDEKLSWDSHVDNILSKKYPLASG